MNELELKLASLTAGERYWFWFSPDAADVPLLMESFSDPSGLKTLSERARSIQRRPHARVSTGIAAVAEDGALQFGSTVFTQNMLFWLTEWVLDNVERHPNLAHLSGATFVRIGDDGTLQDRYQAEGQWAGVPRPVRPGTLEAAADTLQQLEPDKDAWVWMSEGVSRPLVITIPIPEDPSGERFGPMVLAGRRRSGQPGAGLRGVVRRLASGGLLVTTNDSLSAVGEALTTWLKTLGEVRLAQLDQGDVVDARRIGGATQGVDLSAQVHALAQLQDGAPCLFWFTTASKSGEPLLLLDASKASLKALAQDAAGSGPVMRGTLHPARWGLEFRCRKALPDFLLSLADWVSSHHAQWPGLLSLVDARMTVRDKDGEIVERRKDSDAWASLHTNRSTPHGTVR